MRVLEDNAARLVIRIRPVGLWVTCFGLAAFFAAVGFFMEPILVLLVGEDLVGEVAPPGPFGPELIGYAALVPLAVGVFLVKVRTLTLDTGAGTVRLERQGVLGRAADEFPLAALHGARIAVRRATNSSTTHRAILIFDDPPGEVQVMPYGTGGNVPSRIVDAVNRWLVRQRAGRGGVTIRVAGLDLTVNAR